MYITQRAIYFPENTSVRTLGDTFSVELPGNNITDDPKVECRMTTADDPNGVHRPPRLGCICQCSLHNLEHKPSLFDGLVCVRQLILSSGHKILGAVEAELAFLS